MKRTFNNAKDDRANLKRNCKRYRQGTLSQNDVDQIANVESYGVCNASIDLSLSVVQSLSQTINPQSLKQLKKCGSDINRCTQILLNEKLIQQELGFSLSSTNETIFNNCRNEDNVLLEQCILAALQVCVNASKKLKKKTNKATTATECPDDKHEFCPTTPLQLFKKYNLDQTDDERREFISDYSINLCRYCPTISCYAKCISIYGFLGNCNEAITLFNQQQKRCMCTKDNNTCNESGKRKDRTILLNAALAACVPTGQWKVALDVLKSEVNVVSPAVSVSACNIVLNAMCSSNEGIQAHSLVHTMMSSGQQSTSDRNDNIQIQRWPQPDKSSFFYVLNALINQEFLNGNKTDRTIDSNLSHPATSDPFKFIDTAFRLLNTIRKWNDDISISIYFDTLSAGYRRCSCSAMVDYIDSKRRDESLADFLSDPNEIRFRQRKSEGVYCVDEDRSMSIEANKPNFVPWLDDSEMHHKGLVKYGRGRFAYWAYASYSCSGRELTVALKPNTDPGKNGIRILLYHVENNTEGEQSKVKKVGYLLFVNSEFKKAAAKSSQESLVSPNGYKLDCWLGKSTLLGMYLDPSLRKEKLSKVFLSIWLDLCMKAELVPETGIINKPLLALLLQDTFSFFPSGGFDVDIVKKSKPIVFGTDNVKDASSSDTFVDDSILELQSPDGVKSLVGGAIASNDAKRQNIRLVDTVDNTKQADDDNAFATTNTSSFQKTTSRIVRLNCSYHLTPLKASKEKCCDCTSSSPSITQSTIVQLKDNISTQLLGTTGKGLLEYIYEKENAAMSWAKIMLGI